MGAGHRRPQAPQGRGRSPLELAAAYANLAGLFAA